MSVVLPIVLVAHEVAGASVSASGPNLPDLGQRVVDSLLGFQAAAEDLDLTSLAQFGADEDDEGDGGLLVEISGLTPTVDVHGALSTADPELLQNLAIHLLVVAEDLRLRQEADL